MDDAIINKVKRVKQEKWLWRRFPYACFFFLT